MIEGGGEWMIELWEDDQRDFGSGDGAVSKQGTLWNVEGGAKGQKRVGDSERTDHPTSEGTAAAVTLLLKLSGEEFPAGTIVAKGALPYENGDVRSGLLAITGGTGGYRGLKGVVQVDSWNPKKYSVQSGG
jgi:hypothetical protein